MTDKPVAFHDLRAEHFPLVIEYFDAATGELLQTQRVEGPGVLEVPSFTPRRVDVKVTMGNGDVVGP